MSSSFNTRKALHQIKVRTADIRPDPRPNVEVVERDHLHDLFLRLVPAVYEYSGLSIEEMMHGVALRLSAAESRYLVERLDQVRKKQHLAVVSRADEDVLLPVTPDFDPRRVPLAATWTDGGFYTPRERAQANGSKLRKLGLRDGIAGYISYRTVIFNPSVGRPAWQVEPAEAGVESSYEAEALAVRMSLTDLLVRIEGERNLPPADQFHVVLFSDCQSLIAALKTEQPTQPEAAASQVGAVRELVGLFAGFHPQWEGRRRIKQRLGH